MTAYVVDGDPLVDLLSEDVERETIQRRRNVPEIKLLCHRVPTCALLDSGSQVSAIDEELYTLIKRQCGEIPTLPINKSYLICANRRKSPAITKQVLMTLTVGKHEFEVPLLVVKNLIKPIILGTDWLARSKVVLDFKENVIRINDGSLTMVELKSTVKTDANSAGLIRETLSTENEIREAVEAASTLNEAEKERLYELIFKYRGVFSDEPGLASNFWFRIQVKDETPFISKSYPIPFAWKEQVSGQIEAMLKMGIIERASSPYINPLVVVRKRDGNPRICLDARKLNEITIPERNDPPLIDDIMKKFYGAKYFSTTDFSSAFWQLAIHPDDRKYTAFRYESEVYVFNRVPFGLRNSGSALIRCVNEVLGSEILSFVTNYVDDLLISSATFDQHLYHLESVFQKLDQANMKLKLSKSAFCQPEVKFLGFIFSHEGISTDPERIRAIQDQRAPANIKQLRGFIGLCNYHSRFCRSYSTLIHPLLTLLKKNVKWSWDANKQAAFERIKEAFLNTVMLKHPDFRKQFYIQTDSSEFGLGAVLFQRDLNCEERIIALISRTLRGAELNYTTTEKEALAIVWALKKLRTIVLGQKLVIISDHKALTFLKSCQLNHGRLSRWVLFLQGFEFTIQHCTGKENAIADWLSRNPIEDDVEKFSPNEFRMAVIDLQISEFPEEAKETLADLQRADPYLRKIYLKIKGDLPETDVEYRKISHRARRFQSQDDILLINVSRDRCNLKIYVPSCLQSKLVAFSHTSNGHCGVFKTYRWLWDKYYWIGMKKMVKSQLRHCDLCQRTKFPNRYLEGPQENIIPTKPQEIYAVDIYGRLPTAKFGNKYLFVVIDVFSKFVQVYPLNKPNASSCLKKLINHYFPLCGIPESVLSDHGTQFTSGRWRETLRELGVRTIYSSIRRPQANPSERVMRELSRVFRTYCNNNHKDWFELVPWVNKWFNNLVHESTGFSPVQVHFGRQPNRENDIAPEWIHDPELSHNRVKQLVLRNLEKSGLRRKKYQKKKIHVFNVNDRVLLRTPMVSDTKAQLFHKFFHLYTGPFVISRLVGPNSCYLKDETGREAGAYNFHSLKPYFVTSEPAGHGTVTQ